MKKEKKGKAEKDIKIRFGLWFLLATILWGIAVFGGLFVVGEKLESAIKTTFLKDEKVSEIKLSPLPSTIKRPPPPFDVIYLGDHLQEARANCDYELGRWSSAWYNWKENKFWPVCYYSGEYYKVFVPENEKPKHPCLPSIDKLSECDN